MISLIQSRPSPHGGFTASVDPASARRRVQVSAGVVVVLGLAIAVSLFALRPDREIRGGAALQASTVAISVAAGRPVDGG